MIRVFRKCINKADKEYKKLAGKFGDKQAELIVRLNDMHIPTLEQANKVLTEKRNTDIKSVLGYLEDADIVDEVGLRKRLGGVVTYSKGTNFVVKTNGNQTLVNIMSGPSQVKLQGAQYDPEVFNKNVEILNKINKELEDKGYPKIFKVTPLKSVSGASVEFNQKALDYFNQSKSDYIDDKIDYYNEMEEKGFAELPKNPVFSLRRVEDQEESTQKDFDNDIRKWLYTPSFNFQDQLNIHNTLSGKVFNIIDKTVTNKARKGINNKALKILTTDNNGKENQLVVKVLYQDKLKELESNSELSLEESDLKKKLEVLLQDEVWDKFQNATIDALRRFGYKFTKDSGVLVGEEDGIKESNQSNEDTNLGESIPTDVDVESSQIEGSEAVLGKGSGFSELSSIMLKIKDNMSSHLRVWLAGIPSTTSSFIGIDSIKGKPIKSTNTYVPIDTVIKNVCEATLGKSTLVGMITSLKEISSKYPNREFMSIIASKLEDAIENGDAIANEFFTKFNMTRNEMLMVKYDSTPRKYKLDGENVYEKDSEGNFIYDINNKVINVNRNDVPRNLRDNWYNVFSVMFNLNKEDTFEPDETTLKDVKNVYSKYTEIKNSILKHFTDKGELANEDERPIVQEIIKNLFASIGVHINNEVADTLIDSTSPKNKFIKYIKSSVFHPESGYLGNIFENFNPNNFNPEKAFNSSGMSTIANRMALYEDSYMNISSTDEKGRTITAYGLNDHFTRGFWDLINSAIDLKNQRQRIAEGEDIEESSPLLNILNNRDFKGQSLLLKRLAFSQGESLDVFLNNFNYTIYNVTKSSIRGSKAKELPEMNDREFINTKMMLFTNSAFDKWEDIDRTKPKWSYKFLTTPEAKTKMYQIKTPDHDIKINLEKGQVEVLSKTVDTFYNYFLAEYNSIKTYLEGSPELKEKFDSINTYEPKIFYSFGVFNLKSSLLWEKKEDGNYGLREIDEEVERFIKEGIKSQIEEDIKLTRSEFESLNLVKNGKYVGGFNSGYVNKLHSAISLKDALSNLLKKADTLAIEVEEKRMKPEDYAPTKAALMETYNSIRELSDKRITDYMIADYAINYQLHNIEMNMLFLGDPRGMLKDAKMKVSWDQFNGVPVADKTGIPVLWNDVNVWSRYLNGIRENANKRYAGVQASGNESNHQDNPNVGYQIIQDFKVPSKILDEIRKFDPEVAARFEAIPTMDGQEIITPEEFLTNLKDAGKISKAQYDEFSKRLEAGHEDIKTQGFVSPENKFTLSDFVAQAQKPVYFGSIPDDEMRMDIDLYVKPSSISLFPQVTQGTEMDKLRSHIYEWNKSGKPRIDRMPVVSATKLGAMGVVPNVFMPNMDIDIEGLKAITESSVITAPRTGLRTQLEVPYDPNHDSIRISTQQVKKVFSEVLDFEFDASKLGLGTKTGKELKELHNEMYGLSFDALQEEFFHDTGASFNPISKQYEFTNLEKLQKVLYENAVSNGYEDNELEGLALTEDKEEFTIPLAFSGNLKGYQSLLLSLINNVILQKIHGRSFIMSTEQGFKPTKKVEALSGEDAKNWMNYNKTNIIWIKPSDKSQGFNPALGLLPQRPHETDENKVIPGQAAITWNFKDDEGNLIDIEEFIVEEDGHKFLDFSKMDEDLINMIGNRIPIHGHPSMADLQVAAFIPAIMGDLIITSQDLTSIMGADFDIDKLYAYMYNYFYGHEDSIRDSIRDLDKEINDKIIASKDPKLEGFKDKVDFLKDLNKRKENKFNNEEGTQFSNYIINSINTKQDVFNKEYKYSVTSDEVEDYFLNLDSKEIKQINDATYSDKSKAKILKSGEVKDVVSLEELYKGKELQLAKALKNHLTSYNVFFKSVITRDNATAKEYISSLNEKVDLDKSIKDLIKRKQGLTGTKKLMKLETDFENLENNNVQQLHNGLQDIYHTILSNKKVWKKILEGVNEGDLSEVSSSIKSIRSLSDSKFPSMSSDRYKNQEYFTNRSSKLGVGVFSVGNTFFTLIEGMDIYLSKQDADTGELVHSPFNIKSDDGEVFEYSVLSGAVGYDKLISIFQSTALDDVKLQILKAINENKYTMGVTTILAALADDKVKYKGKPVLDEVYLGHYIAQPVIMEFVSKMSSGNDSLSGDYDSDFKNNVYAELIDKYSVAMARIDEELEFKEPEAYSLSDLKAAIYYEKEYNESGNIKEEVDGFTLEKYLKMQYDILNTFKAMEGRADVIRRAQYLVNTDSKGTTGSVQEALFKKDSFRKFMENPPASLGNLNRIFYDKNYKPTLSKKFFDMGVSLPIQLFRGTEQTGPILPYSSYQYESFLRELKVLQNTGEENFYNDQFYNKVFSAYLSNMWANPMLEIADSSILAERFSLVYDTDVNKSLATEVEEYKNSMQYLNNPALRPLFSSLQVSLDKKNNDIKFLDFIGSVGLTVSKDEISIALLHLKDLNYNLFEKLIKYTLIVPPSSSTTSLRRYIPNIYLKAIGVTDKLRFMNRTLNNPVSNQNIAISPYLPPVRPIHQQLFQHFPDMAFKFNEKDVEFDGGFTFSINKKDNPNFFFSYEMEELDKDGLPTKVLNKDGNAKSVWVPVQYAYYFNRNEKTPELYKLVEFTPNSKSLYARIPILGAYNLSEFDPSYTSPEPRRSLIKSNNIDFKYVPIDAYSIIDADLPNSMNEVTGHAGAAYGADSLFDIIGRPKGVKFFHYREDDWMSKTLLKNLSKDEQKESLKVLSDSEMEMGYRMLEAIYKKTFPKNYENNLKARNLYQVVNSTAVFAIAPIINSVRVKGGTNTTIEMAKFFKKPVFVWDTTTEMWYKWNGNRFVQTSTPYLPKNFAGIGTRQLELYKIPEKDENGKVIGFTDNSKTYLGDDKATKANQAIQDLYSNTEQVISGGIKSETEKNSPEPNPTEEVLFNSPKAKNQSHLVEYYGYDSAKSGKENVVSILSTISRGSSNDSYRILADILLKVAKEQKTLDDVQFELSDVNEYQDNTIRIDSSMKDSEAFQQSFQYNFLHELSHHFIISKLDDGSEMSNVLSRNIDRMIAELAKPENLQKAINAFKLKTTPEQLLLKLQQLRQEASVSQKEGATVTFSSEAERSILNPLINKYEFTASLLNDENTQKWAENTKYEGDKQSVFSAFFDKVKALFDNFLRSLNIKYSAKTNTILKNGIRNIMQILSKEKVESKKEKDLGEQLDLFASLKGVSKLTPVEELTPEEEAERFVKIRLKEDYSQRRNDLWKAYGTVLKNPSLDPAEKEEKTSEIRNRINIVNANIDKLLLELNASDFINVATKDINYVMAILGKSDLPISQLLEVVQIATTYRDLAKEYETNKGVPVSNKFPAPKVEILNYLDPSLMNSIKNIEAKAVKVLNDLRISSEDYLSKLYYSKTGEKITPDELFRRMEETGTLKNTLLPVTQSNNILNRLIGKILKDSSISTDMAVSHYTEMIEKLHKDYQDAGFDPSEHIVTYEVINPLTGIKSIRTDFRSRYNQANYESVKEAVYANAPSSGALKKTWYRNQLNKIEFSIDLRYLFPEEFNEELRSDVLNDEATSNYIANAFEFFKSEYAEEYGEDYADFRFTEILQKARDKYYDYEEAKEEAFNMIDSNEEDPAIAHTEKEDWLAANSPFLLLNEQYALMPDASFKHTLDPPYSSHAPKISKMDEYGNNMFAPWSKIDPITGKKTYLRHGGKYITRKARNKNEDGSLTGFIDHTYTEWEKEWSEKAYPIIQHNINQELSGGTDIKEVPLTQFGYLRDREKNQAMFLKMFPYHLTRDFRWHHMLDIGKPLDEALGDMSLWYKFKLLPSLMWDNVVKNASVPLIKSRVQSIDLITKEYKKDYDPSILSNNLNKKGFGDLKTMDLKYYDLTLMKAAVEFQHKAEIEQDIQLIQFLEKEGNITSAETILEDKTISGTPVLGGSDKKSSDWAIAHNLYGEQADIFFNEEYSKLFKAGLIDIKDLNISSKGNLKDLEFKVREKLNLTTNTIPILEKLKLTTEEKEKIKYLLDKKKELLGNLGVYLALGEKNVKLKNLTAYREKLESLNDDISKVIRVSTIKTKHKAFHAALRTKFMGYNVYGRIMDTVSTGVIGNHIEAADGRLFGYKNLRNSYKLVASHYLLPYIAAGAATYAGLDMAGSAVSSIVDPGTMLSMIGNYAFPVDVFTAIKAAGIAGVTGAVINTAFKKSKMKMDQLMQLFGQLDTFESSSLEEKQVITKERVKIFTPMGLAGIGERFNKACTVFAILDNEKVKDLKGKNHPLIDAYKIGDNDYLEWNTAEFGPKEDHGMALIGKHSDRMLKVRNKMEVAVTKVNGDYSNHLTKLYKKGGNIVSTELTLMRGYIGEFFNQRFGGESTDLSIGQKNIGFYRAPFATIGKLLDKEPVPDYYKASNRKAFVGMVLILGGILAAISYVNAQDKKLAATDDSLNTILNLLNRSWANETQALDPGVIKSKSITGISPTLTTTYQLVEVFDAIRKAYKDESGKTLIEADYMTPQELALKGLLPENEIDYEEDKEVYDELLDKYLTKHVVHYIDSETGKTTDNKYRKMTRDDQRSRIIYKLQKLFFSTYTSQQNMKRKNTLLNK